MSDYKIRQIFELSYEAYSAQKYYQPDIHKKAAHSILNCKSGKLGFHLSQCTDCGYIEIHNNSCRNRNCPSCQAVLKEIWVDKRRAEVIDSPYFHVVFTLPHELNPLIYCNQKLLYGLLHRCCAETLLELSAGKKYLGAMPGIVQVLHTWNQELDYHVHMHCIVSGGGLTPDGKIRKSSGKFFLPVAVLRDKFRGKYMALLSSLYESGSLVFLLPVKNCVIPAAGKNGKTIFMKKTGVLISKRPSTVLAMPSNIWGVIPSVTQDKVTFAARGKNPGGPKRQITLDNTEFIRRYLMHVLPCGFQKIRYYGFLNNRMKARNLKVIFKLQNGQRFKQRYTGLTMAELIKAVWGFDIHACPKCGCSAMKQLGRCCVPPS